MIPESDSYKPITRSVIGLYLFIFAFFISACSIDKNEKVICIPENASFQEKLAAKEIRRYIYARTNEVLQIKEIGRKIPDHNITIVVADFEHYDLLEEEHKPHENSISDLSGQGYIIKKTQRSQKDQLWIIGGEQNGVLFGAYHFLENLGIGFYLHDDIIPEDKIVLEIPDIDIKRDPLFNVRGILPFHDFPEGPDWWDLNDYKAIIGQLPKMGMNFIGFHTYPESTLQGSYKAEPFVWIGLEEDVNDDGSINFAYPVLHFNTQDTTWGYLPRKTSEFYFGADKLFDKLYYGTDYIHDISPWPHTENENIRIFNESGQFFNAAFNFSKLVGVKTCVGTESSLTIPDKLKNELKNKGLNVQDREVIKNIYKGIFSRIQKTYPLDYYWLWTPERWTWSEVESKEIEKVKEDIQIAYDALREVGAPIQLATCGWVLGPPDDRAEFDKILPKDMPFSCINREVGFSLVEPAFNNISERELWAIPWLEDDPAMTSPQLWVGRMRKDAFDAFNYGCDGLMGIHWRTINVDPMASALSKAAWEIGDWSNTSQGDRDLTSADFYLNWAEIQFGEKYAQQIATIFTSIDGGPLYVQGENEREAYLYRTSNWIGGPGGLRTESLSSEDIQKKFGFINSLEPYIDKIEGNSNRDRLNYWIGTFRYARSMAILGNTLHELDSLMIESALKGQDEQIEFIESAVLPKRIQTNQEWRKMVLQLLKVVNTKGEMGTVANLQQHSMDFLKLLTKYDEQISRLTGRAIPEEAYPDNLYSGPERLIIPTRRTMLEVNEDFNIKIIVLSNHKVSSAKLYWKFLGDRRFKEENIIFHLPNHGKGTINQSSYSNRDFEYYISVKLNNGKSLMFPTEAPENTRTIVISPE